MHGCTKGRKMCENCPKLAETDPEHKIAPAIAGERFCTECKKLIRAKWRESHSEPRECQHSEQKGRSQIEPLSVIAHGPNEDRYHEESGPVRIDPCSCGCHGGAALSREAPPTAIFEESEEG